MFRRLWNNASKHLFYSILFYSILFYSILSYKVLLSRRPVPAPRVQTCDVSVGQFPLCTGSQTFFFFSSGGAKLKHNCGPRANRGTCWVALCCIANTQNGIKVSLCQVFSNCEKLGFHTSKWLKDLISNSMFYVLKQNKTKKKPKTYESYYHSIIIKAGNIWQAKFKPCTGPTSAWRPIWVALLCRWIRNGWTDKVILWDHFRNVMIPFITFKYSKRSIDELWQNESSIWSLCNKIRTTTKLCYQL